jgi:hypothetical protein
MVSQRAQPGVRSGGSAIQSGRSGWPGVECQGIQASCLHGATMGVAADNSLVLGVRHRCSISSRVRWL